MCYRQDENKEHWIQIKELLYTLLLHVREQFPQYTVHLVEKHEAVAWEWNEQRGRVARADIKQKYFQNWRGEGNHGLCAQKISWKKS